MGLRKTFTWLSRGSRGLVEMLVQFCSRGPFCEMAYLENCRLVAVFAYLDMLKLGGIFCNDANTQQRCFNKISEHRELNI